MAQNGVTELSDKSAFTLTDIGTSRICLALYIHVHAHAYACPMSRVKDEPM